MTDNADNRQRELTEILQRSPFYASDGAVYPYRTEPYEWTFADLQPSTDYIVYLNDERLFMTAQRSNANGILVVKTPSRLEPGEYNLQLRSVLEDRQYNSHFTIRHLATITSAIADQMGAMDDAIQDVNEALAIDTTNASLGYKVYGKRVYQDKFNEWSTNDYRRILASLVPAYRQYAGTKRGLEIPLEALLSTSPFVVPKQWTPGLVPNHNLALNGRGHSRSFDHTQRRLAAGSDYPLLNRRSINYVHPGIATGDLQATVALRLVQPPRPQRLRLSIPVGCAVTLSGLNDNGIAVVETIPAPASLTTYITTERFASLTSVVTTGSGGSTIIGLAEDRYVKIVDINDFVASSSSIIFSGSVSSADAVNAEVGGRRLTFAGGTSVLARNGTHKLEDTLRRGTLTSRSLALNTTPVLNAVLPPTANQLDLYNILDVAHASYNEYIATTTSSDLDSIAASITGTGAPASTVHQGVGLTSYFLRLDASIGSSLKLRRTGPDLAPFLFRPQNEVSWLASSASGSSLACNSTSGFPSGNFDVRVRGLYRSSANALSGSVSNGELNGGGYTFTPADVGRFVRLFYTSPFPVYVNCVITYLSAGYAFVRNFNGALPANGLVSFSIFDAHGEVRRVTSNNTSTNTLTLDTSLSNSWPQFAIVELLSDIEAADRPPLGNISVEVNDDLHPYRGTGDTLSAPSSGTVTLTSTRGVFIPAVLTQSSRIRITGAQYPLNNGVFTVTSRTSDSIIEFSNPSGVAETSQFQWEVLVNSNVSFQVSNTVNFQGSILPDGWRSNASSTNYTGTTLNTPLQARGHIERCPIYLEGSIGASMWVEVPVELAREHQGKNLTASFFFNVHDAASASFTLSTSFDQSTYSTVTTSTVAGRARASTGHAEVGVSRVQGTFFIPYNATRCWVRLTRAAVGGVTPRVSIERILVEAVHGRTSAIGQRSVVRSAKRTHFRELLYAWNRHPETDTNGSPIAPAYRLALGIPSGNPSSLVQPATPGHIDRTTNAHGLWERIEPAQTITVGLYTKVDWAQALQQDPSTALTLNLVRSPVDQLDAIEPKIVSYQVDEPLFSTPLLGTDPVSSFRAELEYSARHPGSYTYAGASQTTGGDPGPAGIGGFTIYEAPATDTTYVLDGISYTVPRYTPENRSLVPLPNNPLTPGGNYPWQFVGPNAVRINPAFYNPTSTYSISYPARIVATSGTLNLTAAVSSIAGAALTDYLWMVDLAHSEHPLMVSKSVQVEEVVTILPSGSSTLQGVIDATLPYTLYVDDGVTKTTIPLTEWSITGSKEISIPQGITNPDAIYILSYHRKTLTFESGPRYQVEWRSAATEPGLASASWVEVKPNQVISPRPGGSVTTNDVHQYHQLRVFIDNVTDSSFTSTLPEGNPMAARVLGLGLKGFRLFASASPSTAPGLIEP